MIEITAQGFDRELAKLDRLPDALREALTAKVNGWLVKIQEKILAGLGGEGYLKNDTGELAASVQIEQATGDEHEVRGSVVSEPASVRSGFQYGKMWEERGHQEIYPVKAKMLAFQIDGEWVFTKRVSGVGPKPWFYPPAQSLFGDIVGDLDATISRMLRQ